MNKILKGVTATTLSIGFVLGLTACGTKKVDFEKNYLKVAAATAETIKYFEVTKGDYYYASSIENKNTEDTNTSISKVLSWTNKKGDNAYSYYEEYAKNPSRESSEIEHYAVEKQTSGKFNMYYWTKDGDTDVYNVNEITTNPAEGSPLEDIEEGILEIFAATTITEFDTNAKEFVGESLGSIATANGLTLDLTKGTLKKSASEKNKTTTFQLTWEAKEEKVNAKAVVKVSIKGNKVTSVKATVSVNGSNANDKKISAETVYEVTISYKANTSKDKSSIPSGVNWTSQGN